MQPTAEASRTRSSERDPVRTADPGHKQLEATITLVGGLQKTIGNQTRHDS